VRVTLALFATLREGRFDSRDFELAEGATILDLVELAGVPRSGIAVVFLDARHAEFEARPGPGSRVALFPPVGGG